MPYITFFFIEGKVSLGWVTLDSACRSDLKPLETVDVSTKDRLISFTKLVVKKMSINENLRFKTRFSRILAGIRSLAGCEPARSVRQLPRHSRSRLSKLRDTLHPGPRGLRSTRCVPLNRTVFLYQRRRWYSANNMVHGRLFRLTLL